MCNNVVMDKWSRAVGFRQFSFLKKKKKKSNGLHPETMNKKKLVLSWANWEAHATSVPFIMQDERRCNSLVLWQREPEIDVWATQSWEQRSARVCVRWGWGGTLLVTWFIIRSCKVVRLEGIRDDKLDLTVGEEGGGGGLTHSWSKGGGVRKKILTARLTVLGPSVPFAVLWRKRCTKALLTPLFAPSLLRLPHTASFSSSFTGRFGCFFICKQLRAWCWADGRGFFFLFFVLWPE